jgi:hypothetical protein
MATKFYINEGLATPYYVPPLQGNWNITTYIQAFMMDPVSFGIGNTFTYQEKNSGLPTPQRSLVSQSVSRRLLPQTISGTIDFVLALNQWSSYNTTTRMHVYIANETLNTIHGTLLNQFEESGGPIWYTSSAGSGQPDAKGTKLVTPQTLTPVTIPSDSNIYKLVIEFGSKSTASTGTFIRTGHYAGSRSNATALQVPDLIIDNIVNLDHAGYFLFSADILLEPIPITNINIENAIEVSLPFNVSIDPKGYNLWYKYTPTVDRMIGVFSCSSTIPYVSAYVYGDQFLGSDGPNGNKQPLQFFGLIGSTLHFLTYANYYYVPGNFIDLEIYNGPNDAVRVGDLFISSDGHLGTSVWLIPETGLVRTGDSRIVFTELGVSLSNAKWALVDQDTNEVVIYGAAPNVGEIARVTLPNTSDFPQTMGTDFKDFYVQLWDSPLAPMYKISEAGVVDPRVWHIPWADTGYTNGSGGQGSFGLSRDGTIAYFGANYEDDYNCSCRRFDMVNDIEIFPPFLPPAPIPIDATFAGEVIVLSDNTILCNYSQEYYGPPWPQWTVHYATNGTVLHIINHGEAEIHHITHSFDDDPDKFWAWTQPNDGPNDGLNVFQLIRLSTGAILTELAQPMFGVGSGEFADDCNPSARFGAVSSCPLMIMMKAALTNTAAGIYKLVPDKTNDTLYTSHDPLDTLESKIPDPSVTHFLEGED